jgi:hypothetical protein
MLYLWITPHELQNCRREDLVSTAHSDKKPLNSQAIFFHVMRNLDHGMRHSFGLTSAANVDRNQLINLLCPVFILAVSNLLTAFSTGMKIKSEQLDKLSKLLLENYRAKELIKPKREDATILAKIKGVISQNFAEEEAIEEEARKMLAAHAQATREMDHFKMFLIAKQKLAAKKGFIL